MDDEEKEFEITITYDHHDYFSSWNPVETMVTGYDYEVKGEPKISEKELLQWVRDQIRDNEKRTTFFY